MSDLPTPSATRLPRPRWLDARLVLGLLLILVSVVVGAKAFAEVDQRIHVWAVTRDLGANTTLAQSDLVVRSVRLDATARRYISADQLLTGLVLTRPVGRHELLPVAAVTDRAPRTYRRVAVEVDRSGGAGLSKGSVVDVYAVSAQDPADAPARPELVLAGVTVAEDVTMQGAGFGGGSGKVAVPLVVPNRDVTAILAAMARGTIYLVQVPSNDPAHPPATSP